MSDILKLWASTIPKVIRTIVFYASSYWKYFKDSWYVYKSLKFTFKEAQIIYQQINTANDNDVSNLKYIQ